MKNLKTYLMILLAFCMVVTIVACGGSGEGDGTTAAPSGNDTTAPQSNETTVPQENDTTTAPDVSDTTAPDVSDTTAPDVSSDTTAPDVSDTTAPDVSDTTAPVVDETTEPVETLPAGDPIKDPWVDDMGEGEWTKAPEVTEEPAPAV